MRRRRFVGAVAGAAGSLVLGGTGCGTRLAPGSGTTTLRVVATDYSHSFDHGGGGHGAEGHGGGGHGAEGHGGDGHGAEGHGGGGHHARSYWHELVDAFEKEHRDIKVEVSVHDPRDAEEKVADMVAKGRAPDVAQIGSFAEYAAADRLHRADRLLSIPVNADFIPSLAAAGELRRVQYGLPFVADVQLLFYNKELFASAKLDPDAPPKTWAELREAAAALKGAGVEVPYGLPLGSRDAPAEALTWMLTNGGGYTADSGLYTVDAPENVATLNWLRDELVGRGLTTADPTATSRSELLGLFNRGKVGMLNGGMSLMQGVDGEHVDYGMAPLPGRKSRSQTTLGTAQWTIAFQREGNAEAVGTFLDYVYAVEQYYEFVHRYHTLPVTVSGSDRISADERHEAMWPFLDHLGAAEFFPVNKPSWHRTRRQIGKHVGRAVLADGEPGDVLGSLQSAAEKAEAAARS